MKCPECGKETEVRRTANLPAGKVVYTLGCGHEAQVNPDRGQVNEDVGQDVIVAKEIKAAGERVGFDKKVKHHIDTRQLLSMQPEPEVDDQPEAVVDSHIASVQVGTNAATGQDNGD